MTPERADLLLALDESFDYPLTTVANEVSGEDHTSCS